MNPQQPIDLGDAAADYWARRDAGAQSGDRRGSDRPSDEQWLADLEHRLVAQMAELHPLEYGEQAAA